MQREKTGWCALALLPALLTGCTTLLDGKYDFRQGWRAAEVIQVAPLSRIQRPDYYNCVRNASPEQLTSGDFAILAYQNLGKRRLHAMPVPTNTGLQTGTKIYANMDSCNGRIVLRNN